MKGKKDRSGKVALVASLIVILLVGVSVFSLYSIGDKSFLEGLGIFSSENGGTSTGKLLTRYDDSQAAGDEGMLITGIADDGSGYEAPAADGQQTYYAEDGQSVPVGGQQMANEEEKQTTSEGEQKAADTEEKKTASETEQKTVSESEQKAAGAEEKKTADAEEEKAASDNGVQDVSGTALAATSGTETTVQDNFSEATDVQDTALMAVDAPVHQVVRDDVSYEDSYDSYDDYDENGEWLFDYDTEEWYYVDYGSYQEAPLMQAAYVNTSYYADNTQVETGEWLFNEDTQEWYYVDYSEQDDPSGENESNESEERSTRALTKGNTNNTNDSEEEELGEWLFNYDTGEWYYVEAAAAGSEDEDDEAGDTQGSTKQSSTWVFDEETGQWRYVGNIGAAGGEVEDNSQGWVGEEDEDDDDDNDNDTEQFGAWVLNEETGEWYYDENAPATTGADGEEEDAEGSWDSGDDGDEDSDDTEDIAYTWADEDEEKEDEEDHSGEWVYDEEIGEWVYIEAANAKDEKEESKDEESNDSTEGTAGALEEEIEEEASLAEKIVDYAMDYVGVTPYVWAGDSLTGGTDCSGFVHLIYDKFDVYCSNASLAYDGGEFGTRIGLDELQPGDIVVYGQGAHVAIYAGDGYVVHCSSPENGTVYWDMNYRSDASWGLRVL